MKLEPKFPSKQYRAAYRKGRAARVIGRGKDACPYRDDETWSRTFRDWWYRGWRDAG